MKLEGIYVISISLPIIDDNSDYLTIPPILLIPDPKASEGLVCISMKEIYFFIMHLINTKSLGNHPLLFNFQTTTIQKGFEDSTNIARALKIGILQHRKEELSKQRRSSISHQIGNEQISQMKARNSNLLEKIKEERIALEYMNMSELHGKNVTKHKVIHKISLVKYSSKLEIVPYEKYDFNFL